MNAIMAYFLNVLLVIIEVFALYQLGCTFFQKRYRGWRMLLLTAALAAVHVGVLLISGGNLLIKLPLFILVDMLWFRIVFRTHLLKCLVVSVLFSSIMMLGDTGLSFGMAVLLGQLPPHALVDDGVEPLLHLFQEGLDEGRLVLGAQFLAGPDGGVDVALQVGIASVHAGYGTAPAPGAQWG